ncbi:NAD(P)-dependent oxidoreductase [Roseomonas sp. NAR14]|uniref:NAD(P)-dependent oxidoreductase n=1 Tax=Roseomonas acroporae TaxID=2937791 RepID=A0A9X1Y3X5_9PROT|nr:NAD(P)-dependent oxidoreductase [Roseomonas acroporae]MCK8782828.1 NAD(P)-dependent oxidoreductase [Roseomonas acroporae]
MTSDKTRAETVGFIGLGMMGQPMARCLLGKGFRLVAYDANPASLATLREAAAPGTLDQAATPAEVAGRSDVIVLMLPSSPVVAAVMRGGPGVPGLLAALRPGTLVIDMGSSVPGETRALAEEAAARGAALIDAPVSGSVVKARAGTLAIMAGGDDAAFARARPVLEAMGETIIRTGAVGSAHAMKALNNYVYAAGLLATAEALQMGAALDLDLGILADVLNASSGRNVATETKVRQHILTGTYAGGFQLGLMRKDLETAGAIAAETGVRAESLALCREVWTRALAAIGPGADNTEIHRFLLAQARS